MHVIRTDPRTDPRWRTLIAAHPDATVFHTPEWISVLVETYQFNVSALIVVDEEGKPAAGLPICEIEDLRGRRAVCLPFSDYCDPLIDGTRNWRLLAEEISRMDRPTQVRCLNAQAPRQDSSFHILSEALWHGIDLQRESESLWMGFSGAGRRAIRKAQSSGLEVREGSREDLDAFYDLHLRTRKHKFRLLPQPRRFFESIWEKFVAEGKGHLLLACRTSEIVAGILFLRFRNTLTYKFNASSPAALQGRPNDLLLWNGIALGQETGCELFDFGLTDREHKGLCGYKDKYATEHGQITVMTNRDMPTIQNPLADITRLLTEPDVADELSERAGTLLYRYFA